MSKWHGGKGSTPRPLSVDQKTYSDNWDRIFGKTTGNIHQNGLTPEDPLDAYNDERLTTIKDKESLAAELHEEYDRFEEKIYNDLNTDK